MLNMILYVITGTAIGVWVGHFLFWEVYVRRKKVRVLKALEELAAMLEKIEKKK